MGPRSGTVTSQLWEALPSQLWDGSYPTIHIIHRRIINRVIHRISGELSTGEFPFFTVPDLRPLNSWAFKTPLIPAALLSLSYSLFQSRLFSMAYIVLGIIERICVNKNISRFCVFLWLGPNSTISISPHSHKTLIFL